MKISKLDNFGRGITYYNNKIMFVDNALIDEDVEVSNICEEKKYYTAKSNIINNESIYRIIPKCPYYKSCGGCNLMHINLDYQEDFKLNKVSDILKKYAGINIDVKLIKNDKELFYRNKITLKVVNGDYGYYNDDSHDFIKIDNCLIVSSAINEFINKKMIKINNGELIVRSNINNEILISVISNDKVIIDYDNIPSNVVGIVVNDKCVYKDNFIYDEIKDVKFKISYNSFFQVNNYMASCIFDILRNNLKGNVLLDLYCGVGTLGLSLKNNFNKIYGIEKIENAIINAKENAKISGIENAYYYAGNTNDVLKNIKDNFDTVIVDPPRSGLNKETLKQIEDINPSMIAYVSCDPMTLARDLNILKNNYNIIKVYALDMFPNTYHVETVCILERK